MGGTARVHGGRHILGHPLFIAGVVLAVINTLWFLAYLREPVGNPGLVRLPGLASVVLAAVVLHRAARSPGLARAAPRFWLLLAVAAYMAAGSLATKVVNDLFGSIPYGDAIYLTTSGTAILPLLWALYRLPLGVRSRGELTQLGLDIATVTISVLLFVWYFVVEQTVDRKPTDFDMLRASIILACAVCVLAIVKVILAGSRTIDPLALRLLGATLLIDVAGTVAQPLLEGHPHLDTFTLNSSIVAVVGVAAGLRERLAAGGGGSGSEPMATRRPFSVLPYLAVVAVDALLLASFQRHGHDRPVVAAGAVLLTAIVIVRQILAFRENARLIDQLASQERRFRSLVQSASDVIAVLDGLGRTTYVSPGVEQLTGLPAAALLGQVRWFMAGGAAPAALARWARLVSEPGGRITFETRFRHADGDWRWLEVTQTNLLHDAAVAGVVTNLRDITESHAYQQQLSYQASHDSLTELANRSLFGEQLQMAIARTGESRLSLAVIDLDDFKAVNDTLGHQAGDELLIAVAERLRQSVRLTDLVARLGGDEFAVLLENITPESVGRSIERILKALTESITVVDQELLVQASIGVADLCPDDDASSLLRHADIAMYAAKAAGKGRYCRYSTSMIALASPNVGLAAELRQAIQAGQLELHYQPIVALPDAEVLGVEALVRWRHPDRGLITPADFIPVAERTGLIVPLGQWVLHEACRQAVAWMADPRTAAMGSISVNISARHLRDPSVVDHVAAALRGAGLAAGRITIEITETAVLSHASALDAAQALRDLGVRIALDDFGTGHSTLSLLQTCPVDQLKLDRSFLPSGDATAIAAAVIQVADALGLEVVAEGVEDATQAADLLALGYRLAQGFHFGRPVPATAQQVASHHQ
jgi:diguanylate cyclase (GGDEF)-like protein/PAS domain S-box-containing protein